jgi:DNA-3-methyladenine glycosylase II
MAASTRSRVRRNQEPAPATTAAISVIADADEPHIRRLLMRRDPRLAELIKRVGPCRLTESRTRHPFVSLVRALTAQQLSTKAAATIFGRVADLVGGMDKIRPEALLAVDPAKLRAAGLSNQKVSYVRDLAQHVADGRLNLDLSHLAAQTDEDIERAITNVKGFGRWSAEMFLMFQLGRADIFPVGDLGIVKGVQLLLGMKSRPAPKTMLRAAEAWRPYRSVAAWYLWRLVEAPPMSVTQQRNRPAGRSV